MTIYLDKCFKHFKYLTFLIGMKYYWFSSTLLKFCCFILQYYQLLPACILDWFYVVCFNTCLSELEM